MGRLIVWAGRFQWVGLSMSIARLTRHRPAASRSEALTTCVRGRACGRPPLRYCYSEDEPRPRPAARTAAARRTVMSGRAWGSCVKPTLQDACADCDSSPINGPFAVRTIAARSNSREP